MKRLFIALPIDKTTSKGLSKFRDSLGKDTPYIRWTPVQNFHITVLFLGDVIEEAIPLCKETIQKVIENIQPFALKIKKPIYAPPHKPTSMIWQT
ncbi:MAG: hypothetical protein KW806_00335, partial [Candidatus Yanofskybacteria bacterium]|nr:hypothetical protein [Candidatus Yanofskybacteria bacterium]